MPRLFLSGNIEDANGWVGALERGFRPDTYACAGSWVWMPSPNLVWVRGDIVGPGKI
jgi:hypothetical protein|eukprot:COSAG01_NODE_470_length_16575_cov_5.572408_2_plen_57_part_00